MSIIRKSKEIDTVDYFIKEASKYFNVTLEVWGTHISGRKKRIDAVLYPNQILLDKDFPNIPVGVEIKPSDLEDGNKKQIAELYHQAIIYRHTRFNLLDSVRFLPLILIYPPVMNYLKTAENTSPEFNRGFRYFAQRLAGLFFIGELYFERDNTGAEILIELCGLDYYKLLKNGHHHHYNSNWGFEVYEREMGKMVEQKKIKPEEYEREVLNIAHRLGI